MGIRGELYTTEVKLDNRSYFFNVKENRAGDVFLQIVESKKGDGLDFDRHQIAIFAEDMQQVFAGLDEALKFVDKAQKAKIKARAEKKAEKEAKYGKKIYRRHDEESSRKNDGIKRTGKVIHVTSKRQNADTPAEEKTEE